MLNAAQLASIAMGFAVGLVFALANLAARRFVRASALLDAVVRLSVFGVIVLGTAELVGSFFAALVRQNALGFWSSFVVGFVLVPWLVHLHLRRIERKNAG
jgi:hypothetical protein